MKPLLIVNPAAGAKSVDRGQLRDLLTRLGMEPDWIETSTDRGADVIIREHPGQGPVVVFGGDGTVQQAASELRGGDRPLAIVPLGTGNVMALRLDIPLQLEGALRVLDHGVVRRLDLGMQEGEPFLLSAGMGIDGSLIRESHGELKKQMGKLAYIWATARTLPAESVNFRLELDEGVVEADGASVVVANFGTQVGPWIFPPDADGGDGCLDVAVLKAASIQETLSLLAAPFRLRPREHRGLLLFRSQHVRVECDRDMPLQVDGEDRGDGRSIECSIDRGALPVLVSSRRPVFQWSREWPPTGLEWEPWGPKSPKEPAGD